MRKPVKAFIPLLLILLFACEREDQHPVPHVMVNFRLNIESTEHIELNTVGGWAYYTGGFRGVIVYRLSFEEFTAFDRACPHHPFDSDALVRVFDPPLATDTLCGSTFLLLDGSVVQGPARHPLRQYRTTYNHPFLNISDH